MKPRIYSKFVFGKRMWLVSFLGKVEEAYSDWDEAVESALTLRKRLQAKPWWLE